jgi:hypothetical protein
LGYSGLLKYVPYLKPITEEEEHNKVTSYLRKVVDEEFLTNYEYSLIGNRESPMYLILIKNPYKITKAGKNL